MINCWRVLRNWHTFLLQSQINWPRGVQNVHKLAFVSSHPLIPAFCMSVFLNGYLIWRVNFISKRRFSGESIRSNSNFLIKHFEFKKKAMSEAIISFSWMKLEWNKYRLEALAMPLDLCRLQCRPSSCESMILCCGKFDVCAITNRDKFVGVQDSGSQWLSK